MTLENYEPVSERIKRFYEDHPTGAIHTELVFDDGKRVVIKASVYRDINDSQPAGTDYAEELLTERGVNSTSRIENCATSAQGRALAAIGYLGSDWTKKPSREEMAKVQRMTTTQQGETTMTAPANAPSDKQLWLYKKLLKDQGKLPPANIGSMDKLAVSKAIEALKAGEEPAPDYPVDYVEEEPF